MRLTMRAFGPCAAVAMVLAAVDVRPGERPFIPRRLEQRGAYRRYAFTAIFHEAPATVTVEMWDESQEFVATIQTNAGPQNADGVQLIIAGNFRREGDVLIFSTGYANAEVRARERPDGRLVPLSSNVPFRVTTEVVEPAR